MTLQPADREACELLIGDLPGEIFRDIRDNVAPLEDLPILARADKLAFVADGLRLVDPEARSAVPLSIRQLINRLTAAGLPDSRTNLGLVVTMWDLVAEDPEAERYWRKHETALVEELRAIDQEAVHIRVAARSDPPLDNLTELREWLLKPSRYANDPGLPPLENQSPMPSLRFPKRFAKP